MRFCNLKTQRGALPLVVLFALPIGGCDVFRSIPVEKGIPAVVASSNNEVCIERNGDDFKISYAVLEKFNFNVILPEGLDVPSLSNQDKVKLCLDPPDRRTFVEGFRKHLDNIGEEKKNGQKMPSR